MSQQEIEIHCSNHEKLSNKIEIKSTIRKGQQGKENNKPTFKCPHCNGFYINLKGHITRKSKEIARKQTNKKSLTAK